MRRRRAIIALAVCLLAGMFLRLWGLARTPPGLYRDEAFNGIDALNALRTGHYAVFYPLNFGREGLFINLQAGSIWLFRDVLRWSEWPEPWMLRVPSAIIGILTLLAFYGFSRRFLGRREALLALFFLSASFWHVLFSRLGFRAIAAPLFLCLGFWLLLGALALLDWRRVLGWACLVFAGIAFGLGFHTYIAFRPMPAFALLVLLAATRAQPASRRAAAIAVFILGFLAVAFPLLYYFATHPGTLLGRASFIAVWNAPSPIQTLFWNTVKTAQMFFVVGDFNWHLNVAKAPALCYIAGACAIAGFLRFAADVLRSGFRRYRSLFLFGLLAMASLAPILSTEGIPHALRSLLMAPPVMILAGYGGVWLYRLFVRRIGLAWARPLAVVLLLLTLADGIHQYFWRWAGAPQLAQAFSVPGVEAGYRLRTLPPDSRKIVVVAPDPPGIPDTLVEARPTMFVAGLATTSQLARMQVRFTSDPAEAYRDRHAIVLNAVSVPLRMRFPQLN